jgi:hypothetical protein
MHTYVYMLDYLLEHEDYMCGWCGFNFPSSSSPWIVNVVESRHRVFGRVSLQRQETYMVRVLFRMQGQLPSRSNPVCHWTMETTHNKHTGSVAYVHTAQIQRSARLANY